MTSKLSHVNLHLMRDTDDVAEFMRWLGERRNVLGVDTETGGIEGPHRDALRLIQFGDLDTGWAIPWHLFAGVAIDALNKYEGDLVLHNSPFDAKFIQYHSGRDLKRWKWEKTNDTMTMAHIIDPKRSKGLKPLAARYIGPEARVGQSDLDDKMKANKWTWSTVPWDLEEYWLYGALDPVLTAHLYEEFETDIKTKFQQSYDLEMAAIRVTTNMMLKGFRVDENYCVTKREQLKNYANKSRLYLHEHYGIETIGSREQVIASLTREGFSLNKKTATGALSVDKEVLESIDHVVPKTILNIRKAEKMVASYFDNLIELMDDEDRVHPTIWTCGARTGRMSVTDPALQTLPRNDPTVRNAFIASEGHTLVSCDYSQVEARLMAHFSQDPGLISAFHSNEDFFCNLAGQIFKEPIEKSDPRRDLTKGVTYGKLYGAGYETMARSAGVADEVMQQVEIEFDKSFPGVKSFQRSVEKHAKMRENKDGTGWIRTPNGRILPSDKGKGYTLVNYLIQGHAAEIMKKKLAELDAVGLGDYMLLPVHDEVMFEIPDDLDMEEIKRTIGETMSDTENYLVPIEAEPDVIEGAWGSIYE